MRSPHLIRARPPGSAALALLNAAQLPVEDLHQQNLENFFYAEADGAPLGLVGLELYDDEALLRSLVVDARERGRGLGQALVAQAEAHAQAHGVRAIYLLTMSAEAFFKRLGYARLDRAKAPASIQGTHEYTSLCPQSAAFMAKEF